MKFLLCCMLCSLSLFASAEKVVRFEGIKIKADNEAPQVMYIIPWQQPYGAERLYTSIDGAPLDEVRPLDPEKFRLELNLYKDLQQVQVTETKAP